MSKQEPEEKPMGLLRTFIESWRDRSQWGEAKHDQNTLQFMPAALEVLECPPSPAGKWLGRSIILLFCIATAWATMGEVDIVAVAEGKIISSGRIKDIQPLEKGVIKAIHVKEGDSVKAGQPLVELDKTLTTADQTRLKQELRFAQLNWLRTLALLEALKGNTKAPELNSKDTLTLSPHELLNQNALLRQSWLDHRSRVETLLSQKREREATLKTNAAEIRKLKQTLPLVTRRVQAMRKLVNKNLSPELEYLKLEQDRIEQKQTLATHQTQREQYQAAVETIQQQLNTLKAEAAHKALTQIDEYQRQIQSLTQELTKAEDLNAKQILRAPVDGTVQQLTVHTIGGVVTEAQVLMRLVPKDDYLEVEAVLENKDVGFVFEGQKAEVKVNTFNFTKYGIIDAEVVGLTPDAIVDEVRGLVYKLRLKLDKNQMQVNERIVDLLPGMAVMAEVKTGKRRLIEYVLSPLLRKVGESVRER